MNKTICYYHSRDLDGWCSAAIVRRKYPDAVLIGWDYGDDTPGYFDEKIRHFLVDITFDPLIMQKLRDNANVFWIDHHKSAIKDSVDHEYSLLPGTRDDKFAACELTWKYLFPENPVPRPVELLGLYDSFRHKNTDMEHPVLLFQYAARTVISSPAEVPEWFFDSNEAADNISKWIEHGMWVFEYVAQEARRRYNDQKFLWEFEMSTAGDGYPISQSSNYRKIRAVCINAERLNPANFGVNYHEEGYDVAVSFFYKNGYWEFSLYNDDGGVDVSRIAKIFDGGGHAGAAGFRVTDSEVKDENFIENTLRKLVRK